MAIEIEKKYRLTKDQYESVLRGIEESGASFEGEDFEENNIYRSENLENDRAVLRLRKTQTKAVLTYKRRLEGAGAVKRQIEHETVVADPDEMKKIIECLGYEKVIIYEKRRRTWKLRQAEIVLDELPFGFFMEIEGSPTEIAEAEMILGLESVAAVDETYPQLTEKLGRRNGRVIEARFV